MPLMTQEIIVLKNAEQIKKNQEEDAKFAESVEQYLSDPDSVRSLITLGSIPKALTILEGVRSKPPMQILPRIIGTYLYENSHNSSERAVLGELIKNLLFELRTPALILKGDQDRSFIAVLSSRDRNLERIMMVVPLIEQQTYREVGPIVSMRDKEDIKDYLEVQLGGGKLVAANRDKGEELLRSVGLQLPRDKTLLTFDNSIAYSVVNCVKELPPQSVKRNEKVTLSTDQSLPSRKKPKDLEQGPVKTNVYVNYDFYHSLKPEDRMVETMPETIAKRMMIELTKRKIPFSAVQKPNGITMVTVDGSTHAVALRQAREVAENAFFQEKQTVNKDYFFSIPAKQREQVVLPALQAELVMSEMKQHNIPFSALKKAEQTTITVDASKHSGAIMHIAEQISDRLKDAYGKVMQEKPELIHSENAPRSPKAGHSAVLPTPVARELTQALDAERIPYHGIRSGDSVVLTVQSEHQAQLISLAAQKKTEHRIERINPDIIRHWQKTNDLPGECQKQKLDRLLLN